MEPAKFIDHVMKLDTEGTLAVTILLAVFAGYRYLDYKIRSALDAKVRAAEHEKKTARAQMMTDGMATAISDSNAILLASMEELHKATTAAFVADRAALALDLAKILDDRDPDFTEKDRGQLVRLHNAKLGVSPGLGDGSLRYHQTSVVEDAVHTAADNTGKILETLQRMEATA